MSIARKILMGAAGAGSKSTYVDDVFSTYLYKGTDVNQTITNGIKLGNANAGASVNFADYGSLVVPTSADFKFGTGAFTIEFFIYFIYSTNYISIFDGRPVGTNGNQTTMNMYAGGQLNWYDLTNNTAVISNSGSTALPTNAWTHVAYVKEGTGTNQAKLYFNGSLVGTGTDPQDYAVDQLNRIGGQPWSPGIGRFSISNYRVVKGTALYTSNFTTPTVPLTNISGTVLLCCQSSTDPFAATVTPGTITIGSQTNAVRPVAQSFGTETATDGKGGLVWLKERTGTNWNQLYDTARGVGYALSSNSTNASSFEADKLTAFNNAGFSIGVNDIQNDTGDDYASWSFRKSKGFFDIVTYTGNGTAAQNISHNLGSVPGMIMVKRTDATSNWWVYNRGIGATKSLFLQSPTSASTDSRYWNDTAPTASQFTVGEYPNTSGATYIAYVFAGGASDEPGAARSVAFAGTGNNQSGNDYLSLASTSDVAYGTGDFTIEAWLKPDTNASDQVFLNHGSDNPMLGILNGQWQYYNSTVNFKYAGTPCRGHWSHFAISRSSGTTRFFINGQERNSFSDTHNYGAQVTSIGAYATGTYGWNGGISNVRIVKGTAVYTSSFKPSTTGLTAITNTKLLCCNKNTVTGSTVTPGTITSNGSPQSSTITPFDDPEGFKFGEEGDQNLIKCGSFTTDSNEDADVYLGWEPQYVLIKRTDGGSHGWNIVDSMRGFPNAQDVQANVGGGCQVLEPNFDVAEISTTRYGLTPTGFYADQFGANRSYVYMALRRPDGYVGKPVEAGTDAFAMDTGNASSTIPNFDSGFPVGFAFMKTFASSGDWYTGARLLLERYVKTNSSDAAADWGGGFDWDSNVGWLKSSATSAWQSWMWKRGAGFDVATYKGNGTGGHPISHSLNKTPEMIWVKNRTSSGNTGDWMVGHKDLYGGSSPWNGYLVLNKTQQQYADQKPFYNVAPTSTVFTLDGWDRVNANGSSYIAILFASANDANGNPISKVGSYTGNASSSGPTITLGFAPRFIIIKCASVGGTNWFVYDTLRGLTSGNDQRIYLNTNGTQTSADDIDPSSTGFQVVTSWDQLNDNNANYIYYAHA